MFSLKTHSAPNFSIIFYNPWLYFFIFTITNSFLAYGSLNLEANLYVALMGWVFPMVLGLIYFSKTRPEKDLFHEENLPKIPISWWAGAAVLAAIPRLYLLLNSSWFVPDEGLFGTIALELIQKWRWDFFLTVAQHPPLSFWMAAIYFKLFAPSVFSMRFFTLFLSIPTAVAIYVCCRYFFSKSITFLCCLLFAFSFWPLYTSKFFEPTFVLLLFEIVNFCALGLLLNSTRSKSFSFNTWLLGFITGLGFLVSIQWPLAALMILIAVFCKFKKKTLAHYGLWIPFFLFLICLFYFSLIQKNGDHIKMLLSSPAHEGILKRLNDSFSNWTALFWGCDTQNSYGPVWGGMLNPISGSLFFIGIFELVRHRKNPLSLWMLTSFFIFMLPGFITSYFEVFRNALIAPLLIFICVLGFISLLSRININKRGLYVAAICLVAATLDFIHLLKYSYPIPNPTYQQAFTQMDQTQKKMGPGLILVYLQPDTGDLTWRIACYPFNAVENPRLDSQKAVWASMIENANYKPFIQQRFPQARFYALGPDSFWNQGPLMLVIIPITNQNRPVIQNWVSAEKNFHKTDSEVLFDPSESFHSTIINKFMASESSLNQDRFLESVFYEKLAYLERKNSNLDQIADWIKLSIQKGYPASHLLVAEGLLLRNKGNYVEAKKYFKEAIHAPLNLTDADKNLKILGQLEKTN